MYTIISLQELITLTLHCASYLCRCTAFGCTGVGAFSRYGDEYTSMTKNPTIVVKTMNIWEIDLQVNKPKYHCEICFEQMF